MNDSNKNFRIKTNNKDKVLNVNLTRDIDFLEILSLKIAKKMKLFMNCKLTLFP